MTVNLYKQIFHQFFWTILSFIIFLRLFHYCFASPIFSILKIRLSDESVLKNLIDKNLTDKAFYNEEKILLKKAKKDKIDSYVVRNLSKDEKIWNEELIRLSIETKNYEICSFVCSDQDSDILEMEIKKLADVCLRRYLNGN